jgi:hypothetical protein
MYIHLHLVMDKNLYVIMEILRSASTEIGDVHLSQSNKKGKLNA